MWMFLGFVLLAASLVCWTVGAAKRDGKWNPPWLIDTDRNPTPLDPNGRVHKRQIGGGHE